MDRSAERPSSPTSRRVADHLALRRALKELDYEFHPQRKAGSPSRTVGYAPASVVEIIEGPPATVSLLFSASTERRTLVRTAMVIVAVANAIDLEFQHWLSAQMRTRGLGAPWSASRRFDGRRVRAELLTADAMLLTIEGAC